MKIKMIRAMLFGPSHIFRPVSEKLEKFLEKLISGQRPEVQSRCYTQYCSTAISVIVEDTPTIRKKLKALEGDREMDVELVAINEYHRLPFNKIHNWLTSEGYGPGQPLENDQHKYRIYPGNAAKRDTPTIVVDMNTFVVFKLYPVSRDTIENFQP